MRSAEGRNKEMRKVLIDGRFDTDIPISDSDWYYLSRIATDIAISDSDWYTYLG